MPITDFNPYEDDYLGPIVLRSEAKGARAVITRLLQRRFGPLPPWAEARLSACTIRQLEELSERVPDCTSLEDLLGPAA